MLASLILATTLITQVQVQTSSGRDSLNRQQTSVGIQIGGSSASDSNRRIPVTAAHLATAFKDAGAKAMLLNARAARFQQDSALRSYDAKVRQRISVGLSMRANARERLVVRDEGVARVQWQKNAGAVVDILGKRTTVPVADDPEQIDTDLRNNTSLPIPYFPGRETLWIGGSVAQVSVDEGSFVHPIASGAEAYYKYETGDSVIYTIGENKKITLRELRILAREPRWNVIVGSFWYDQATSQLVRAVYRPSIELNVWEVAMDEAKRDSTGKDDAPPWWVRGIVSPLKMSMDVFVVEYGLFEGRFWLPTSQGAEGKAQAMMVRVPVTFEERYEYASVNAAVDVVGPMASVPQPPLTNIEIRDSLAKRGLEKKTIDSLIKVRNDSINVAVQARVRARADSVRIQTDRKIDSLVKTGLSRSAAAEALRERNRIVADSIRVARETQCALAAAQERGYSMRRFRRYRGSVDVLLRVPCDLRALAHSAELPASAYDPGEEVFGKKQRDEMMDALDFGLQAGWGPQKIGLEYGFAQSRYNRVEGFSTAIAAHQQVGMGYSWSASLRAGTGDRQLNGEFGIDRSNGRTTYKLNAYRRLVSANDWGTPLSFSSSFPTLLIGRDEGVYFRSWGGELVRSTSRNRQLDWRLFAEQEWTARVTTRFSVFGGTHDDSFGPNVVAERGTFAGASMRWRDSWGLAPRGWKVLSDFRLEGAGGKSEYGRGALDLTVSHPIAGPISFGLTAAGGTSVGDVPVQRYWFLGGSPTVRGQSTEIDSVHAGNAFWFTRVELARGRNSSRLSVFGDLGWAGSRDSDWGRSRRLLSGVGIGSSFMDGLFRTDISRGLWPNRGWRLDFSIEAPF